MAMSEQTAPATAADSSGTIIHRKAAAGLAEHQARAMSLAKALRLTFAKVADTLFDMSIGVISVRRETLARDAINDALGSDGLRMVFDGPMRARAAVILDGELVASLIQQQTMGKVLPDTSDSERTLTATDAAVCAPFLEEVLNEAAKLPEDPNDVQVISDYRFGVWAEDARILGMALEAQDYDLIHIDLDIAGGVRQGHALLCMPQIETVPMRARLSSEEGTTSGQALAPMGAQLSETVLNLEAEVRISLAQARMSLRKLGQLEVGATLDLVQARFDNVAIQTIEGRTVARAVLGQLDGNRAVQVKTAQSAGPTPMFNAGGLSAGAMALAGPTGLDPDMTDMASMGADLADISEATGIPDLPDMPEFDDTSDLPDLPDMTDLPDLPDMGALEDLPDLPELD